MRTLFLILFLLPLQTLQMLHTARADDDSCDASTRALLACLEQRAPEIQIINAQREAAGLTAAQARERTNPQLTFQVQKSPITPNETSVQSNFLFPLDLHGVRNLRGNYAAADAAETEASGRLETQQMLVSAYLSLHRIRQLGAQAGILRNTGRALAEASAAYRRRPQLSPAQSADLEILALAQKELQAHLALVEEARHALEHDIEISLGAPWTPSANNLPQAPTIYPAFNAQAPDEDSPVFAKWASFQDKSNIAADLAKAEKKTMLWIGPSLEWDSTNRGVRFGVALQVSLPVLESHRATFDLADHAKRMATLQTQAQLQRSRGEWMHNVEIYADATANLVALNSADAGITQTQRLFKQGLISGAVYIESLRQYFAVQQQHDELEYRALDAWCQLQIFQNQYEKCFL